MNFINKMERKLGKYAIPNLTLWLIGCYGIGYIIQLLMSNLMGFLLLEPYFILHGQVWRLISWVLIPPSNNILFALIMMSFYYFVGTSLERTWGAFRYNLYLFGGIIFTILGSFVLYFILGQPSSLLLAGGYYFNTVYINLSLFLAFALTYPDMQVMLYFIIPIKVKWLGALYAVFTIYEFINIAWVGRVAIIMSLLNFIIFFLFTRNYKSISPKEIRRKKVYRQQTRPEPGVTKHKCAICGKTEKDGEDIEFRFCSKCEGNYEYCQEHLFTHQHIKRH